MDLGDLLVGIGASVTAFGVTAVVVIELVRVDPVAGILGVIAGLVVGLGALTAVLLRLDALAGPSRWGVHAIGGFGWTMLGLALLTYVNAIQIGGPTVAVGAGLAVAALVFAGSWFRDQE